jgi:putative folate metabolism gamma-glutamate ligase
MNVISIKTHKITTEDNIFNVIDKYVDRLEENSILVVTSKIVALCEGNVVDSNANKDTLVKREADMYLPKETNTYQLYVSIKNNVLAVNAGIDESNSSNGYVLWPKVPQKSANIIRQHLKEKFKFKNVGVIITDSKTTPLRSGITGIGIAHSGFKAINDQIGQPDIFGKELKMTKVNIMDGISAAACVVMGESSEQTPLAIVTDIPFVKFCDHNPTSEELDLLDILPETDVYGQILNSVDWKKSDKKS